MRPAQEVVGQEVSVEDSCISQGTDGDDDSEDDHGDITEGENVAIGSK